jgi:hypothetical protein
MATPQRGTIPSVSQDTSRPYFTQRVKLNSLHAQQVFNRGYDLCANAIFSLSIVLRVIGSDEQAHEIEGVVDERINKQFEDLRAESARLDKVAEANGIEFSGIDYSSPKDVEARITSPRAVRYIGLIREFDALVAKFDTLWLSGVIPDGNYSRSVYEWKRWLLRLAGGIRAIASQAMIVARKKEQLAATASAVENTNTGELAVVDALNEVVDSGSSMESAPTVA